LINNKYNFFFN